MRNLKKEKKKPPLEWEGDTSEPVISKTGKIRVD